MILGKDHFFLSFPAHMLLLVLGRLAACLPFPVSVWVWVTVANILVSGSSIVAVVSGSSSSVCVLSVEGQLLGGVSCCGSGVDSLGGSGV